MKKEDYYTRLVALQPEQMAYLAMEHIKNLALA